MTSVARLPLTGITDAAGFIAGALGSFPGPATRKGELRQ
jgi:hypothetical protein